MEKQVMNGKALWKAKGGKTAQESKPAGRGQAAQRALMIAGAIVSAVVLIGAMVAPLCAQSYPTKPIRLIISQAPGGSTDILGRLIGQKLTERLGQPVVPENRPGAGGNIAFNFAAKSKPDGYTILLAGTSFVLGPSLDNAISYDPIKDFAPISLTGQVPYLLIVRPSLPVKSLKELVEYAKANPGKLNYGSSGIGSSNHLAVELFRSLTEIKIVHVPYKGGAQQLTGMMGGENDMGVVGFPTALSQIQAGKVRALAVLRNGNKRLPLLPNVPTTSEAGIDNCEVTLWYGIVTPAGTPRDIVNRLNAEWVKSAAMPDTMEIMKKAGGVEPLSGTPEQFSNFLKAEIVRWAKIIKEANLSTK